MVDTAPQIIWIADANGRMEFLSRPFSHYTGYRRVLPPDVAQRDRRRVHPSRRRA
ncbi:PAS domain-containing protein [Aureimonas psammosilenae]|uniref:PAS domain-containing protein n=1 Tax=Aureimonas psammosilenae TaxID=2495496 RepID=UPI0022A80770|nr:PAS domain-containing protein [Aureimonas psammosilenae]